MLQPAEQYFAITSRSFLPDLRISSFLYAGFVIQLIVSGQLHPFGIFADIPQAYLNEMYIIAICLMALAYWQHKANILRLIKGEERKTYLGKKSSENLSVTENKYKFL